ncbi:MAG TPA: prepilin-type N-terminal cleavage/methylation domain-containing protein [Thermoanaerobaculia bacterium]|nr:prepilin-type N-terminal cleavage/methylation domain-containing protein [Thermoanaerobaculia bacterium]
MRRISSRHSSAGFNLVEVLIAVAILGVVAISIFTLFVMGRRNIYSGKQTSQAIAVGTQVLEDLAPLNKKMVYSGAFGIADDATGDTFTLPRVSGRAAMSFVNSRIRSTNATILTSPPADISTESTPPAFITRWRSVLGTKLGPGSSVTVVLTPDQDPTNDPAEFETAQLLRIRVVVRWNETNRPREAIWDTVKAY